MQLIIFEYLPVLTFTHTETHTVAYETAKAIIYLAENASCSVYTLALRWLKLKSLKFLFIFTQSLCNMMQFDSLHA